ncbi:unnamed protein product, partial [Ectocarpus fasciculatus]
RFLPRDLQTTLGRRTAATTRAACTGWERGRRASGAESRPSSQPWGKTSRECSKKTCLPRLRRLQRQHRRASKTWARLATSTPSYRPCSPTRPFGMAFSPGDPRCRH